MKRAMIMTTILIVFLMVGCNKQKKLMNGLIGSWKIEKSERAMWYSDGSSSLTESIDNAGTLVIYEDSDNPSKESKLYDFFYIDAFGDTIQHSDTLVTDQKNKRIILLNALGSSSEQNDLVWTIEKEKKNKQVWSAYGVDTTYFYPANHHNPGAASNWLVWTVTLKKE